MDWSSIVLFSCCLLYEIMAFKLITYCYANGFITCIHFDIWYRLFTPLYQYLLLNTGLFSWDKKWNYTGLYNWNVKWNYFHDYLASLKTVNCYYSSWTYDVQFKWCRYLGNTTDWHESFIQKCTSEVFSFATALGYIVRNKIHPSWTIKWWGLKIF